MLLGIHQDITTQLCTALHQLGMHEFLTDVDHYLRATTEEDLAPAVENLVITDKEQLQLERAATRELLIE